MKKPIIGITASQQNIAIHSIGKQPLTYVNSANVNLVTANQGIPILLPPTAIISPVDVEELMSNVDGLLLSSGEDLSPHIYSEELKVNYTNSANAMGSRFHRPLCLQPNETKDKFEFALYQYAKKHKIPILGICRGMQLINVAEGGTLHQENPETNVRHELEPNEWIQYHEISINKDSKLYQWMKRDNYFVSSIHHQSIKKLGNNLVIAAQAPDGIAEIIESKGNQFIVGVQGHIEQTTINLSLFNTIFDNFFMAAKNTRKKEK